MNMREEPHELSTEFLEKYQTVARNKQKCLQQSRKDSRDILTRTSAWACAICFVYDLGQE